MKKLVLILAIAILPVASFAQSIFDQFEDLDGVTSVVVNQNMFKLLSKIDVETNDPESQEYLDMIENLTSLKVLTTGDEAISVKMKGEVDRYLKRSKLQELMRVKDGEQTVKFYIKEGKNEDHVSELLMFITGLKEVTKDVDMSINGKKREFETVLLTLTGDIDLKQISKLTNQMDIPGGKQLEKAGKEKKKI
ncbi:MAG: DUF4252 domain-containing protein [Flavobacteriaceae bacterium]|nr:DUF4252 domain-containing protein [Bacteroidia bacterium]NNL16967.1 DUF4252 domain-containing protein [Flavobacteriaceae bacterium]